MAKFIEETDFKKIAKAFIANHGFLWVLVAGEHKENIRNCILTNVQALGIDPKSILYKDIEYSICTKEEIKNRPIAWNHDLLVCDIDGLINEVTNLVCPKICIKRIR